MKSSIRTVTALLAAAPSTAGAHASHAGGPAPGWVHYLVDPYHLLFSVAVASAIGGACWIFMERSRFVRAKTFGRRSA